MASAQSIKPVAAARLSMRTNAGARANALKQINVAHIKASSPFGGAMSFKAIKASRTASSRVVMVKAAGNDKVVVIGLAADSGYVFSHQLPCIS